MFISPMFISPMLLNPQNHRASRPSCPLRSSAAGQPRRSPISILVGPSPAWLLAAAVGMLAFAILGVPVRWVKGDVFVLRGGAQLRGNQLPLADNQADLVAIRTAEGVRLTLARSQVIEIIVQTPAELAYEQLVQRVADTVPQLWELCEWCREQKLGEQRAVHLRRILELDPDHVQARHALGYSEVGGEWVTQEQIMRRRGYQQHQGRWKLTQEVDLAEEQHEARLAVQEWNKRLKFWRERTAGEGARAWAARIEAIRDPHAVPALSQYLRQEPIRACKLLYLEALTGIGNGPAIQSVVVCSLIDPDTEVFHECVDRLVRIKPPLAVEAYIKTLEDPNNVRVNRAAHALGRLGDGQAIGPLITALVTTHRVVVSPPGRGAADAITSTFGRATDALGSPMGGTGLSTGGGTRAWDQTVSNQEVLTALYKLSGGQSFGFDQRAWRVWLAQEKQLASPANLQRR